MNDLPKFDAKAFVDPNLLKMARDILAGVEAGDITGLGVVVQGKTGTVAPLTWGNPLMLYFGADLMKAEITTLLKGNVNGKILRPN